jgi:hypothetical protein
MGAQTAQIGGMRYRGGDDGAAMPSWSPSSTPQDGAVTPPEPDAATVIERVRRLLVQLLTPREPGNPPPSPDK